MKTKVMTIVGTRPEIIKLSRTIYELDKFTDHILVHTGQNYDYELNEIFFKDLNIRKPDYFLNAAGQGAKLAVLPENFAFMGVDESSRMSIAEKEGEGMIQDELREIAVKNKIWIVGGTIPIQSDEPNRAFATSLMFNDKGEQVARYDKIHLFDVELSDSAETYFESQAIKPGKDTVVVDTPVGKVGMAICYDLRFPEHFRKLIDQGAELFVLPSAFAEVTGKAHWEVLLRARSVENLTYMVAAAQGGYHISGRKTYGHSMVVDFWGGVNKVAADSEKFIVSDINLKQQESVRKAFPVLQHRVLAESQ